MAQAYLNHIATSVPDYDIHNRFVAHAPKLLVNEQDRKLFTRMVQKCQIDHRYSFLPPDPNEEFLDSSGFYANTFPCTERRMQFYKDHAFILARKALDQIDLSNVTHLILTSCTGFYAPGLDLEIVQHYELNRAVERSIIGFMGCQAAFNALKLARHIVRSDKKSRILVVNIELCTLHLKQGGTLEEILSYLIFADGCAASIISAEENGLALHSFKTCLASSGKDHITWHIGNSGFDMVLSGQVPALIRTSLTSQLDTILGRTDKEEIKHWAFHPGGRSILDALRDGLLLSENHMAASRRILRRFGNMSSASIMFVLNDIMQHSSEKGEGCAMALGPGLTIETMRFALGRT